MMIGFLSDVVDAYCLGWVEIIRECRKQNVYGTYNCALCKFAFKIRKTMPSWYSPLKCTYCICQAFGRPLNFSNDSPLSCISLTKAVLEYQEKCGLGKRSPKDSFPHWSKEIGDDTLSILSMWLSLRVPSQQLWELSLSLYTKSGGE